MRSVLEAVTSISQSLSAHQIENGRRQAEELLCDVLKCNRLQLYLNFEQPLSDTEWRYAQNRLTRRLQGEPLAYIEGSVEFYGCTIQVSPQTLIPRQETEILVDKIAEFLSKVDCHNKVLLDLCCGSGCIGIALKNKIPALKVVLSDLSPSALKIARDNASANHVDVIFKQGDLLEPFLDHKFDYFVCNPPYISEEEFVSLDHEVVHFEPKQALVSGVSGLEFYERLAHSLPHYLNPGARVWFEIGYKQGEAVKQLFSDACWQNQKVENDWSNNNRFFTTTFKFY